MRSARQDSAEPLACARGSEERCEVREQGGVRAAQAAPLRPIAARRGGAGVAACRIPRKHAPLTYPQIALTDLIAVYDPQFTERQGKLRAPEVVEFAVSPRVGQAVLAFARSYSNSGPNSVRAGRRHRLPHLRSSRHRKEWLSPFFPPGRKCGATSGGLILRQAARPYFEVM